MNRGLGNLIEDIKQEVEVELGKIGSELSKFEVKAYEYSESVKKIENRLFDEIKRGNRLLDEVLEKYKQPEAQLKRVLNIQEAILEELEQISGPFKRPEKYFSIKLLDGTDEREMLNGKARMGTRYLQDTSDLILSKKPPLLDSHFLTELEQLELNIVIKT